jgi:protoheme IX farnesyltransferase
MEVAKQYYRLTKPGIIQGNSLPAIAGFLLASGSQIDFGLFLAMLIGLALVIASACVFNNYIDRDIDSKMERTKNRATANGNISFSSAITYATVLGVAGFFILIEFTNTLTALVAAVGFIFYVVLYGYYKRRSVHGTLVGSVSGAVPPVVGYCAVAGQIDATAITLFLILVLWQMPHFYAIAIFRASDYAAAKIPVLPAVRGHKYTKSVIILYIIAFIAATLALKPVADTSWTYLAVASVLGLYWLRLGLAGLRSNDDIKWSRKLFGGSLVVLTLLCVVISLNQLLP